MEAHAWREKDRPAPDARRRFFLVPAEVPRLLIGGVLGDPVALRRILGGRRAGRIGCGLFAVGLFCAMPGVGIVAGLLAELALAWLLRPWPRAAPALRYGERLRLSLWTTAPPLIAALPLRLLFPSSLVPGLAGILVGHALLVRGLRTGLRSPAPDR